MKTRTPRVARARATRTRATIHTNDFRAIYATHASARPRLARPRVRRIHRRRARTHPSSATTPDSHPSTHPSIHPSTRDAIERDRTLLARTATDRRRVFVVVVWVVTTGVARARADCMVVVAVAVVTPAERGTPGRPSRSRSFFGRVRASCGVLIGRWTASGRRMSECSPADARTRASDGAHYCCYRAIGTR